MGIPAADRRERRLDARRLASGLAARPTRRLGAGLIAALALTVALPAAAGAQTPTPTPTPPPAPPPPPPAEGKLTLQAQKVHRDGKKRVELTGEAWRVRGVLEPYVAGQTVLVRFYRRGRKVHEQTERVLPWRGGKGTFLTPFESRRDGRITVRAVHVATPQLEGLRSNPVRVNVLRPRIGSGGTLVRLLQKGLARLRYAVPRSGVYDAGTQRAVMAWRKVTGNPRSYAASEEVVRGVLGGRGAFRVRYPRDGRHVEADISRQVLALIDRGGKVHRIYHTSSGAPATPTVLGRFRVYRKSPGTNAKGMVHSSYFIRGYAVHGYASVPPYNASHGCLRVPIPDAWRIYTWMRMGTVVRVYP